MKQKIEKILLNTTDLFQKYGIKSLTMSDIARLNMVSKKTLYNYVSDKAELVELVLQHFFAVIYDKINQESSKAQNAIEEMLYIQKQLVEVVKNHNYSVEFDLRKYYPLLYDKMNLDKSRQLYKEMKENIERGQSEGLYRQEVDADLIAKSRVIFQTQRIDNEFVSFKEFANVRALKHMMEYHMRAICTEEGLKVLTQLIKEFNNENCDHEN
ncbi:MAG: TetR/AcrR family transcriptional regulator [Bacteroidota bacterium]|nr:TetR/AcrR family transcriptional regulator [Bacteroidota bacterium]